MYYRLDKMVGLSSEKQQDASPLNPSPQVQVTQPLGCLPLESEDQFTSGDDETVYQGKVHKQGDKGKRDMKHLVFNPQVTVNVFSNNGPSSGTTRADGSNSESKETADKAKPESSSDTVAELKAQIEALSRKVDKLSVLASTPVPRIECGLWNTGEVRSWQNPSSKTVARIDFSKEFKTAPTVTTGMSSADVSRDANFRVSVYPNKIDTRGFTVNVDGWDDTVIYSAGVSWVAIGE
ncbi:hypothetical protein F5Y11DRAFT_313212 [Daldinia sp. FL1419]|nr:hypothetical protein F5Y11DRAFT_313212 [Daldinia sp. FL1419]